MSADPGGERPGSAARKIDPYASRVRDELRRVYIGQGARVPLMAFVAIAVLGMVMSKTVPVTWLEGWAVCAVALIGLRWGLCVSYSRAEIAQADLFDKMRVIAVLRIAGGLCVGGLALVWFPSMSLFDQLIFMIVCLGWYATTIVVSLASPVSTLLFGFGLLGPLALAWALYGGVQGEYVALLVVLIILLLRQSTDNAHAAMRVAIRSRLREEELSRGLEEQRGELEAAMLAKSQFLAAASHDLRQPVTSMNLLLAAMMSSRDESALRSAASKFEAPLNALEEILSTILEVSRLEAGIVEVSKRECAIGDIVAPVIAEYLPRASAKGVRLDSSLPDFLLYTDPDIVRRVLRNLVDNAIKFTDTGSVRIEARSDRSDTLLLSVIDTGAGIEPRHLKRIFDDYFQGENPQRDRRQGLGLGLAIVWRLVVLLGGKVEAHSRRGRGARFDVRLPGAITNWSGRSAPGEVLEQSAPTLGVSRVLVVEDDRLVVEAMATLLSTLGVEARYATDADDAMRQTSLGRFIPDLALVDIGLPGPVDGISLVKALRLRIPRCAFLLVTGDTRPEVMRRATDAGIPILHKPVSFDRLNEKLKTLNVRT